MNVKLTRAQQARYNWEMVVRPKFNLTELAEKLPVSRGTVHGWHRVPEQHVPAVSAYTNIPKHDLRPDLFEPPGAQPWDD